MRNTLGVPQVAARTAVLVLLDAGGVGEDGRAVGISEAAQHALATGIVEVLLLVGGAGGPLRQVIQNIVGEGAGRAVGRAAGHVAKAIVGVRGVDRPGLGGAGGPGGIEPGQLMRLGV